MTDCDCNEEYGPCEQHGTVLAQRAGASNRTADELTMVLIHDLRDLGVQVGSLIVDQLDKALEDSRDPVSGCAWFENPDDAQAAYDLALQMECNADPEGALQVFHDDGYIIVQIHDDCPLLED